MGTGCLPFFLALALSLCSPPIVAADKPVETQRFGFYGSHEVVSTRYPNGDITAQVQNSSSKQKLGALHLSIDQKSALWVGPAEQGAAQELRYYDLQAPERFAILKAHDLRSAAVSAFLHWEEFSAQRLKSPHLLERQVESTCESEPDGCTGWFDECGGLDVRPACDNHDRCYRCALASRAECDLRLFDDVVGLTGGDYACASAYYWGVRGLGWLFYEDPSLRPSMGADVYAFGVSLNACPEGMQNLCTTYYF